MPNTWMPFFTGDYLKNTMHLSAEEHGAYLLMILHYWSHGKIKNDKKTLKNITKISSNKLKNIISFFDEIDGYLIHSTIERLKGEAIENKDKQRKRTEAATAARWGIKEDNDVSVTDSATESPSPSTSSSIIKDNTDTYIKAYEKILGKKLLKLSDKRKKHLKVFARNFHIMDFEQGLNKAKQSLFLMSGSFFKWDWIINETNFLKIMEGNYDDETNISNNRPSAKHYPQRKSQSEQIADGIAELAAEYGIK